MLATCSDPTGVQPVTVYGCRSRSHSLAFNAKPVRILAFIASVGTPVACCDPGSNSVQACHPVEHTSQSWRATKHVGVRSLYYHIAVHLHE